VGQERLGPAYFFISLVLGPLNSLLWYVPSSRYMELGSSFLFLQEQIKDIIILRWSGPRLHDDRSGAVLVFVADALSVYLYRSLHLL
jgi:hypothetical protein